MRRGTGGGLLRSNRAVVAAGAALAVLVVFPLTRRGWLVALDWIPGPHWVTGRWVWGLDGGAPTAALFHVLALASRETVGPATAGWVPVALFFPIAAYGMARLVPGSTTARLAAALLYCLTPIVYERLFVGHLAYLLGYALLPYAVASLLAAPDRRGWERLRPALWMAVLTALSPHFAWITGVVLVAVVVQRRATVRTLLWAGAVGVAVAILSAYAIVPSLGRPDPIEVGQADLAAYRTQGDPALGLYVNVAGLYGFWRGEPRLPKDDVPGWPLVLGAILLVAAAGARAAWRDERRRPLVLTVAVAGGLGYLLALGDQGPAAAAFRWAFDHVPGFAVMREPQKFVVLVALAYAVLFGMGVDRMVAPARGRSRLAIATLLLVLPLAYNPSLFGGLRGRLEPIRYPASWAAADRLMGDGDGNVLFLPWHQYLAFEFTDRRIVANPADHVFRRHVIVGDNVELPGLRSASRLDRSRYLEFLFAHGTQLRAFGTLVAPLGVEYVVLARTVDHQSYGWLDRQDDLERVLDRPDLLVYRNRMATGPGGRVRGLRTVEHWGEVVALANEGVLGGEAVVARRLEAGPIASPPFAVMPSASGDRSAIGGVTRQSPVRYEVAPGAPGYVVLGEPYDRAWRLAGRPGRQTAGGTLVFRTEEAQADISFHRWGRVRLGYAISIGATALLFFLTATARKRRCQEA